MHKVKCFFCGKYFDADTEPFEKPRANRYAHRSCYESNFSKDDEYVNEIYRLMKQVFGDKYDYLATERQRKTYLKDGLTNEDIYNALNYFYIVKGKTSQGSGGRIGIVPFVVEEARQYFNAQKQREKQIEKMKVVEEPIKISLSKIERKRATKQKIDLSKLE